MTSQPASAVAAPATPARGTVVRATAATAVAALVANLIIWAAATAVVDVPDRFTPLQPGAIGFLTVVGVAAAGGLFRLLLFRVPNPTATFRRIVPVALVLSLVPDALIWATGAYGGAAKAETVLPLMAMHVAAALACATLLPALAITGRRSA